jgi:hypothetical protein
MQLESVLVPSFQDGEQVTTQIAEVCCMLSVKFGCSDFLLVFLHDRHINLTMTVLNNMANTTKDDESATALEMCEF